LCQLAKELKKEIPKICTEKKYSFAKKVARMKNIKTKKPKNQQKIK